MIRPLLLGWIVLFAMVTGAACIDDDDDASAGDDDAIDDDVGDDDAADDDAVDDDVADDDVDDDAADDDAANDDDVVCEDAGALTSTDACKRGIARPYCLAHVPLIVEEVVLAQSEATSLCRQAATDLWQDVHQCCVFGQPLARCLSLRGWPADYPAVFDPVAWAPLEWNVNEAFGALNLFFFALDEQDGEGARKVSGGIVDPAAPLLRLALTGYYPFSMGFAYEYATGQSDAYSASQIDFPLTVSEWNCVMFDCALQEYHDVLSFTPVGE